MYNPTRKDFNFGKPHFSEISPLAVTVKDEAANEFILNYSLSIHAAERMNQRGISRSAVINCLKYGEECCKQKLCFYYCLRKNLPQNFTPKLKNHLSNMVVVADENSGQILTIYKCQKGFKHIRKKSKRLAKGVA